MAQCPPDREAGGCSMSAPMPTRGQVVEAIFNSIPQQGSAGLDIAVDAADAVLELFRPEAQS